MQEVHNTFRLYITLRLDFDYLGVGMRGDMRPMRSLFMKDGYRRVVVDTDLNIEH